MTRTRSAQHAVERAKSIVQQNNIMIEKIHENFGLKNDVLHDGEISQQDLFQENFHEERLHYANFDMEFKISTGSKIKNYFKEIFKSIN